MSATPSSSTFRYSEAKTAERFGVSRGVLKDLRDRELNADLDWRKIDGEVVLSNRGLKRLWRELRPGVALFDLRDCLVVDPQKKNGAAGHNGSHVDDPIPLLGDINMPIPIWVTITSVCLNPSVVLAKDQRDGRTVNVWVGRNANFTVGMAIRAVAKKETPGYWRYVGPMPQRRYTTVEWERRLKAGFNG